MRRAIATSLSSFSPSPDMEEILALLPKNSTLSITTSAVHSSPNINHISQFRILYIADPVVTSQKEWLQEDLKSTVLISAEDLNDLVFDAKNRIAALEVKNEKFRTFIQKLLKNKDYVNAKGTYLAECKQSRDASEKHIYESFSELCNVIIGVLPDNEAPETNEQILSYRQDPKAVRGSLTRRVVDRIKEFLGEHCSEFEYENRILRLLCQEKLDPLTSLREQVQYAQAFCDVLQGHRWLYDHLHILHRDISIQNIMVRRVGDKIFGVLDDPDLASELTKQQDAISKHRTGTRPFMAYELLEPGSSRTRHLYRHDLESIFYVMLCLCCRYDMYGRKVTEEYQRWYTGTHELVAASKFHLVAAGLTDWKPHVTIAFTNFYQILIDLRKLFRSMHLRRAMAEDEGAAFDEETGNGAVTYEKFLSILETFNGQQLDLYYRNPSPLPQSFPPSDTAVEEADLVMMVE
ncbi:hypothetical protein VKT23_011479 [Stygiomarasmius scandens]|uniref:Fungal-type protein kinase domain-containing protein n=1 Tax=Marasmiellus scandens TaxID=2682957 RepID=A0ABR1J9A0_9AGAR